MQTGSVNDHDSLHNNIGRNFLISLYPFRENRCSKGPREKIMQISREPTPIFLIAGTLLMIAVRAFASFASNLIKEEQFRIPVGPSQLKLFLRHLSPANHHRIRQDRVVLILHGGTLPSGASSAFRFDGHSWMDDLSDAGFDGLFVGNGKRSRRMKMRIGYSKLSVARRSSEM